MKTPSHVNREKYVHDVASALQQSGSVIIGGGRRWGKTTLATQFVATRPSDLCVSIDTKRLSITPEQFCIDVMGLLVWHANNAAPREQSHYRSLSFLQSQQFNTKCRSALSAIDNELQKIKPDHELLLTQLWSFVNAFSTEAGKKVVVVFDNAEHLLDFHHFSSLSDVSAIFRSSKNVEIVFTTSLPTEFSATFSDIPVVSLPLFSVEETKKLIINREKKLSEKEIEKIHQLSSGHPFILQRILDNKSPSIERTFYELLLNSSSDVHAFCDSALSYYLSHARGQTLSKAVLSEVANEELRLSELARRIYRSAPVTKSLLQRLMDADVVIKKGKTFAFADPVLARWLKLINRGYENNAQEVADE